MQSINLNVEQFLSFLASPVDYLDTADSYRSPGDDERNIMLVWADEIGMRTMRPLIVVKERYLNEFLAFATTYIKTYSPFTAFFRVISERRFMQIQENLRWPSRGGSPVPHELVGIIMAEAFAQLGQKVANVGAIPLQACQATMSMSLLEHLHAGGNEADIGIVADHWIGTKRSFSDEDLFLPSESIAQFWQIIASVYVDPGPLPEHVLPYSIRTALESFVRRRELTEREWIAICEWEPRLSDQSLPILGSREERLQSFDQIVAIAQSSKKLVGALRDIVIGAAASFVANGSLNYFSLMREVAAVSPAAILWFAFFASLHRKSDVFTIGDALGRHLENRLFVNKSIFDRPTCDISLEELYVLGLSERALRFRTLQASSVVVEISPLVTGKFRVGKSERSSESQADAADVTKERWAEIRYLADRLTRVIYGNVGDQAPRGRYVSSEKQTAEQEGDTTKQSDFFETRPKGGRRSAGTKRAK